MAENLSAFAHELTVHQYFDSHKLTSSIAGSDCPLII